MYFLFWFTPRESDKNRGQEQCLRQCALYIEDKVVKEKKAAKYPLIGLKQIGLFLVLKEFSM